MRHQPAFFCLFLLGTSSLCAQRLPHSNVLLFQLVPNTDSLYKPQNPRFLTAFNPTGYNNQPCFFSERELYLTAQLPEDTTQTEIFCLDLSAKTRVRVTATPTAEYSPKPVPGSRRFSAVRVEADGRQRLWSFPLDRSDNGRPVLSDFESVGYYCWLRDTLLAVFQVGENGAPHTLSVVSTDMPRPVRIASNIGRCLEKSAGGQLFFVQKATDQTWFLKKYDPITGRSDIVTRTLPQVEDFAILPDGTLFAAKGARLYQFKPGQYTDWREVANLASYGLRNISRIAVSSEGMMALVTE